LAQARGLGYTITDNPGMSLRDYFAAHYRANFAGCTAEEEARERYDYADAMLAQRSAK
jgi:hypothetical protein